MTSAAVPTPLFTELSARRLGPVRRFFARRPGAMDVVVVVWFVGYGLLTSLLAVGFLDTEVPEIDDGDLGRLVLGTLGLTLLGTTVLVWRRRAPVVVTAVMAVLGATALALTGSVVGFDLGVSLGLYAVAAGRAPRATWTTFAAAALVLAGSTWLWEEVTTSATSTLAAEQPQPDGTSASPEDEALASISTPTLKTVAMLGLAAQFLLAVAIGTSVRNRRLHVAELVDRANALARDRDQQTQLARAAERSRIAREMHDVVAHSLSVMIALADGAGAALTRAPDRSRAALDELGDTGRAALADMRRVLGVLDGDGGPATAPGDGEAPLEPQPGRSELTHLVERFRHAGLPVRTSGLATPLPADTGLQLALFRIAAEALTNTLRHAPGTPWVELRLDRRDHVVELVVTDAGARVPPGESVGGGRGLIGMTERATVYGGSVEAGPTTEGGWRVRALLPWSGGGR